MQAKSFPCLVWRLAQTHHEGALLIMSQSVKIPQSTLWRWVRGLPRAYNPVLVRRLAEAHDLAFEELWDRIQADERIRNAGKEVPTPDLGDIPRGPVPLGGRHGGRRR